MVESKKCAGKIYRYVYIHFSFDTTELILKFKDFCVCIHAPLYGNKYSGFSTLLFSKNPINSSEQKLWEPMTGTHT